MWLGPRPGCAAGCQERGLLWTLERRSLLGWFLGILYIFSSRRTSNHIKFHPKDSHWHLIRVALDFQVNPERADIFLYLLLVPEHVISLLVFESSLEVFSFLNKSCPVFVSLLFLSRYFIAFVIFSLFSNWLLYHV